MHGRRTTRVDGIENQYAATIELIERPRATYENGHEVWGGGADAFKRERLKGVVAEANVRHMRVAIRNHGTTTAQQFHDVDSPGIANVAHTA
ncbi:MAG: hypothetical protein RI908_340, partial [Actinomycetota bacterium]